MDISPKSIKRKLWKEFLVMKMYGVIEKSGKNINVSDKSRRSVSIMMRNYFASMNTLREYCISN
ncbi:MAG: hypothetical protein PHF74_05400 [Dehalococcoidales bacterium]|nr:hypothetical protein [Dehalococcoidales bacterium]